MFYIVGIWNFALFCSCDLDLDPMTSICKTDPCHLTMYLQTKNELSIRQGFQKLPYYLQSDILYVYRQIPLKHYHATGSLIQVLKRWNRQVAERSTSTDAFRRVSSGTWFARYIADHCCATCYAVHRQLLLVFVGVDYRVRAGTRRLSMSVQQSKAQIPLGPVSP